MYIDVTPYEADLVRDALSGTGLEVYVSDNAIIANKSDVRAISEELVPEDSKRTNELKSINNRIHGQL